MRSKLGPREYTKDENKYPYIGFYCPQGDFDGTKVFHVLFTAPRSGVVINEAKNPVWHLGEYKTDWFEPSFKRFLGEIALSND